jgi:NAD(P)-dependent dehydrogenase (short-subunit alcohol dehydrogenase family)
MSATALQPLPVRGRDLAGKVAVIVGSGRDSISSASALASAGAAVTLAAADESALKDAERAIRGAGGRALAIHTDVTEPQALGRLVEATVGAFGRLDVAVNSPGSVRHAGQLPGSRCRAVYLAMEYELPAMLRSGGGVVVNSALAPAGSRAEDAECVIGLTRAAALDHADRDVRINAIAYGPGTPEDFAAAALWLCSERAGGVNGAAVPVGLRPAAVSAPATPPSPAARARTRRRARRAGPGRGRPASPSPGSRGSWPWPG